MSVMYWQQKRPITSKQFPPSSLIQTRHLYENKYQPKHYQPVNNRLNVYSATSQLTNSPYFQYSTTSNQSYNKTNSPYAPSAYGVYRHSPANQKVLPSIYTNLDRRTDLRSKAPHYQKSHASRSTDHDYYYPNYEELNGHINAIYIDENDDDNANDDDNDDDEENCSDIVNYTFDDTGVSLT